MRPPRSLVHLSLTTLCLILGLLLVVQIRSRNDMRQMASNDDWDYVVAELVDNNARLRDEIESLERQVEELQAVGGSAAVLESLVGETNQLRVANGLVAVSGPGVEVLASGPASVLDLQDLINELRNAGAEALALNGQRLVVWSVIATDGAHVTLDGQPVEAPYRLVAIGDAETLESALLRPGGLVALLGDTGLTIEVRAETRDRLALPVCRQPVQLVHARLADK